MMSALALGTNYFITCLVFGGTHGKMWRSDGRDTLWRETTRSCDGRGTFWRGKQLEVVTTGGKTAGKQLERETDEEHYGGKNVEAATDAEHYGGKTSGSRDGRRTFWRETNGRCGRTEGHVTLWRENTTVAFWLELIIHSIGGLKTLVYFTSLVLQYPKFVTWFSFLLKYTIKRKSDQ